MSLFHVHYHCVLFAGYLRLSVLSLLLVVLSTIVSAASFAADTLRAQKWRCGARRMPFYKMIVPTVDTVRYQYLVYALMSAQQPVMLVGPVGTGKTSVAQSVLNQFDKRYYSVLTINMSAQVFLRRLYT